MEAVRVSIVCWCLLWSVVDWASTVCEPPVKVNLNTASVTQLMHAVKGIGKQRAEAIVRYRDAHGGFHALTELAHIRGLGPNFVKLHLCALEAAFTVES